MQKKLAGPGMRPNFVPTPIQRVRAFLGGCCGTRIKPWADSIEVLDALHDTLLCRRGDDAFWADLTVLLDSLSGDLRRRMEAEEGSILPNEVLRREGREALISEIRSALERRRAGRGGFRRLASSLSMPAAGLLMLLGGAMTLGCEDKSGPADTVMFHVQCLMNGLRDVCDDPAHAGTFDYDAFLDQCATPVYLGIRFE